MHKEMESEIGLALAYFEAGAMERAPSKATAAMTPATAAMTSDGVNGRAHDSK